MSRDPINWKDHVVEHPNRYKMIDNKDGTVDLIREAGKVWEEGTPVNAVNLNIMDQDILKKAKKVTEFIVGDLASLDENGDLQDSGKKAEDFLLKSDVIHNADVADGDKIPGADVTAGLQGQVDELNGNLAEQFEFKMLGDDTDFNELENIGWYNLYTLKNAPITLHKNRWLVHVHRVVNDAVGFTIQTAYLYMGAKYAAPYIRHLYFNISDDSWLWSEWKQIGGSVQTNESLAQAVYSSNLMTIHEFPTFLRWDANTLNTPYKNGVTEETDGFAFSYGRYDESQVVAALCKGSNSIFINAVNSNIQSGWKEIESTQKLASDILEIPKKMQVCNMRWNEDTLNTPFKEGLTDATHGFALSYAVDSNFAVIIAFAAGKRSSYVKALGSGKWTDWEEVGNSNTNTNITSGTILDFVLKNKSNKKDAFVTVSYTPPDAPQEAREGYLQILRGADGQRIIVRFQAYYGSDITREWYRTIFKNEWNTEWATNVTANDLRIKQVNGDINDYIKLNTNSSKSYFITPTLNNTPKSMSDHAILTVNNFGLYTTMTIIDSHKNGHYWAGWNTQTITESSWNSVFNYMEHTALSTNLGIKIKAGLYGGQKCFCTSGIQTTTWSSNVKYGLGTIGGIYAPTIAVEKQIIYKISGDQVCYGLFEISILGDVSLTPFNVAAGGVVRIYETYL